MMWERRIQATLLAVREAWDRRARDNARHYVATGQFDWSEEEFFRSGERTVADFILNDLGNICQGPNPESMRVLEIGCGVGRVTRALAQRFGEVHAVDISGEMVRRAREALTGYPNAHVYQNNGVDLSVIPTVPFDFAFSTIVFQHIHSRAIMESYFREVNRLLRLGSLFKLDVQGTTTAPRTVIRRLASDCARMVVPSRRRLHLEQITWFGRIVSPREARRLADTTGFELRYHHLPATQNYWLWLFKRKSMQCN